MIPCKIGLIKVDKAFNQDLLLLNVQEPPSYERGIMLHYSSDINQDRLPADTHIYLILEEPIQMNEDTLEIPFRLYDPFVCNLY